MLETMPMKTKLFKKMLLIPICIAIIGCAAKTKTIESPVSMPDNFSKSGNAVLPEKWWMSFNDPNLNELMDEAIGNNFSILSAWDRLTQAEQIAVKQGADLLPKINYTGDASRTRRETSSTKTYSSNFSAGLTLSYEVDLWGKIRSSQQAAVLDAIAAQEDVYAAAITLTSSVAITWYQLAEAKQATSILNQQVISNQNVLDIITTQFSKGIVGAADVYRQQQLVESTRGKLIKAKEGMVVLQHQLSVLLGKSPELRWKDEDMKLIELPSFPETGLPSSTVQNRPDIQRAFKSIQAADKRVAVAIADQYPRLSILASAESSSGDIDDLFDGWASNLAANVIGPLYDAGLRKAEVLRTKGVLSERINNYGQAILVALNETEDAISQEAYQKQYLDNLNQQLKLSRQVYKSTELNYLKGRLDYIRVLDSLVSQQNLEIAELNGRRVLIERRIDLCKAIAGSWEIQRPEPKEINN